jgi:hypothetical protein
LKNGKQPRDRASELLHDLKSIQLKDIDVVGATIQEILNAVSVTPIDVTSLIEALKKKSRTI